MTPILLLAGTALLAAPAAAPAAPSAPALSTIIAGLEARGYRITGLELEAGALEVEALAPEGRPVELALDPGTGAVLGEIPDR